MDKRVLLVSYLFPPTGGAGVQRNLKYVKYLPESGWQPLVLTVKDINYYLYDNSLLKELTTPVEIIRTNSLDPLRVSNQLLGVSKTAASSEGVVKNTRFGEASRIVQLYRKIRDIAAYPDTQLGWIPFAVRQGVKAIRRNKVKVIMGSIGPVSNGIVASILARKTGLPYILDFRDGWLDDPYAMRPTKWHEKGHIRLERKVVGNADFVTVYDEYLLNCLVERYPRLKDRIAVLPNGFDPADLKGVEPAPRTEGKQRIVYTGNLYGHHEPNLTALLTALNSLPAELRDSLEVLFVGNTYAAAEGHIAEAGLSDTVKCLGYRAHSESLSYLLSADATLLFIRPGDVSSLTGKVFEYFMAGRPILAALEPEGACARVLRSVGQGGWIVPPSDSQALAASMISLAKAGWPAPSTEGVNRFSRQANTEKLAAIFDKLL